MTRYTAVKFREVVTLEHKGMQSAEWNSILMPDTTMERPDGADTVRLMRGPECLCEVPWASVSWAHPEQPDRRPAKPATEAPKESAAPLSNATEAKSKKPGKARTGKRKG